MKNKKKRTLQTEGTPAVLQGMPANSPEFIPGDINDPKDDFVNSLNDVFDYIPEIKSEKYR